MAAASGCDLFFFFLVFTLIWGPPKIILPRAPICKAGPVPQYIHFPSLDQQQQYIEIFENIWGVPQCIGAMDGSHTPVSPPSLCHTDYYNRKVSILIQAVVYYKYCFLDIYTGWPGIVHDACVLAHSSFYRKANAGQLLSEL